MWHGCESGYGYSGGEYSGTSFNFILIVVLFVLLIIVGISFSTHY